MDQSTKTRYKYLPVSSVEEDWGLYVTTAGYSLVPPDSDYPPVRHPAAYHFTWSAGRVLDDYQIVYVTSGSGRFESEGAKRTVEPGSLMFLRPGVWHRYRPRKSTGWKEYWVGLNGWYIRHLAGKGFFSPGQPVVRIGLDDEMVELFIRLIRDAEAQPIGYQQMISSLGLQILALALADMKSERAGDSHNAMLVQRAREILSEELESNVDMRRLAEDLNVSYTHFRRTFKHYTNLAPHQYHLALRIARAKELLRNTSLPVKAIAATLGFESQYYFSRAFKARAGQSPRQWRQMHCKPPENS